MPFTRISLPAHRMDEWQASISAILQNALVYTFSVPKDDCLRSEDFLLFHITAGKPRNSYQKQELYRHLAENLHVTLGISPADVMIVVNFTQPEDWSFSHGEMFQI